MPMGAFKRPRPYRAPLSPPTRSGFVGLHGSHHNRLDTGIIFIALRDVVSEATLDSGLSSLDNSGLHARIARNVVWSAIGEISVRTLSFATLLYLARALGPTQFGSFALAQAAVIYVWVLGEFFGSASHAAREISAERSRAPALILEFLSTRLVAGVVLASAWAIVVLLFQGRSEHTAAMLSGSAYLLFFPLYADWLLRGLEEFRLVTFVGLFVSGSFLVAILILTRLGEPVWMLVIAWAMSFLFGGILILILKRKILFGAFRWGIPLAGWRHARGSATFALAGVATLGITQIPQLALGLSVAGSQEVGYLASSLRLVALVITAGQVLCWGMYPILSSLQRDGRQLAAVEHILQRISVGLGVGVATIGFWAAPSLVSVLFGKAYAPSVPVLRLLILALPIWLGLQALEWMLLARHLEARRLLSFAAAIVFLVLGLLWAIPRGTAVAVASAVVLSLAVAAAGLLVSYVQEASWRSLDPRLLRTAIAGTLTSAALIWFQPTLLIALGGGVLYAAALYLTGAFDREDVQTVGRLLLNRLPT